MALSGRGVFTDEHIRGPTLVEEAERGVVEPVAGGEEERLLVQHHDLQVARAVLRTREGERVWHTRRRVSGLNTVDTPAT